jgi:uncharacterized PurR-regulated membrane protein YhhQ (DUF165 family)
MKPKWLIFSKVSLLLLCIGFFMPVSCDSNGVELARMFYQMQAPGYAILVWIVLIAAILSIVISLFYIKNLKKEPLIADWILLSGSIFSGLFTLSKMSQEYFNLQAGAYIIIAGWILSLIFLILATCSKQE